MVATVGSISIDLSTNASKFAAGFKSSATTVEQQSSRMAKSVANVERQTALMAGTLKNFGTGLVAGGALAAFGSLTGILDGAKRAIAEFDEIAANSRTVGLRTDTYQALGFAAQQANIDQDSLNSSLKIFAKNAGLAEQGTGALYSGLKKLNPELLQNILNTSDQEERLKLVAEAMKNASSATEQAALSAAVFGKGGVDLARIMDGGRVSIDRFKKSAQDMGIIIPDDLLQRAGELDDKLDVLSKVVSVNLSEALVKGAPLVVALAEAMAQFAKELSTTSENVARFMEDKSVAGFFRLIAGDSSNPDLLGNKIADALDHMADSAHRSAEEINADIASVSQQVADLQQQADRGIGVGINLDEAQTNLKRLQDELRATQAVGVSAANAIRASFAEAFRASENASMAALAKMLDQSGNTVGVTRYGGDPDKIELPNNRFNYQENVNGSGVNRTSFGGTNDDERKTADNTEDTADNVDQLDRNTKTYLESLSQDIGQYSAQQIQANNVVISKLSDVTAETFGQLSSALLGAIVAGSGPGSGSSGEGNLFGDEWNPRFGSVVSGRGYSTRPLGKYGGMTETADDGTSSTSVNVQQPGTNITLNYNAAQGESEGTARQNARAMFDELRREASRA